MNISELAEQIGKPSNREDGWVRSGMEYVLVFAPGRMAVWPPKDRVDIFNRSQIEDELVSAISLAQTAKSGTLTAILNQNNKVVVDRFETEDPRGVFVAVLVHTGHGVNKSLHRIIRRAARRQGLTRVESRPCPEKSAPAPRAPSSAAPATGTSSPSPAGKTSETGASPAGGPSDSSASPTPRLES